MAYRVQMSIGGTSNVSPWSAQVQPTAGAGGCSMAYGPVANICQSSVPVTQMVPVTTVTPIANSVQPQTVVGQPMSTMPMGKGAMPMGKGAMPMGKGAMPLGAAPGIGSMSKTMGPWGANTQATTGIVPGIYTQDVSIPWAW